MTNSAVLSVPKGRCIGAQPAGQQERIPTLDIIRGLGVFGILIVNIQSFALVSEARSMAIAPGDIAPANSAIWFLTHVLADGKFMAVFSLLFGAGICLMSERIESRGLNSGPFHYRRMGFLIVVGLLHAYLLWSGDILFTYGICGSVCWLFRRSSPLKLFLLGLITLLIGDYMVLAVWAPSAHGFLAILYQALQEAMHIPLNTTPAQETLVFQGSWLQQMSLRVPSALNAEVTAIWVITFWRTCGAFLIGMALFKTGYLTGAFSKGAYKLTLRIAAAAALISAFACWTCVFIEPVSADGALLDFQLNYWLSLPIGLGWATVGILVARRNGLQRLKTGLQAIGRTAFTNYIMQTLICTTVFYGHGLGLFGRLDRMQLMLLMVLIWIGQMIVSTIWLRYFAYGPIEWLLRCTAYWQRPESYLPETTTPSSRVLLDSAL